MVRDCFASIVLIGTAPLWYSVASNSQYFFGLMFKRKQVFLHPKCHTVSTHPPIKGTDWNKHAAENLKRDDPPISNKLDAISVKTP
jgi:hypothetical protein